MPNLTDQQRRTANILIQHEGLLARLDGEAAVAAELEHEHERPTRPKKQAPTGYMVQRMSRICLDSGVMVLPAGRRLSVSEDAGLIGDIRRSGEIPLIPLYD